MNEIQNVENKNELQIKQTELMANVSAFVQSGVDGIAINLPKNYDLNKALKNFMLKLPDVKNIDKCTTQSIFKSAQAMVNYGLDLGKNQGALIARKDKETNIYKLHFQKQYQGNVKLALATNQNLKEITGTIIYKGDEINITHNNGRTIIKHKTSFENFNNPIIAAYATAVYKDKSVNCDLMTIKEINTSWSKSPTYGKVHKEFPVMMAKKTVMNRLASFYTNTSDDSGIIIEDDKVSQMEAIDIDDETGEVIDTVTENTNEVQEFEIVGESVKSEIPEVEDLNWTEDEQKEVLEQVAGEINCVVCGEAITSQKSIDYYTNNPNAKRTCYGCRDK